MVHKPKQTEVQYDIFKDYIGCNKGEPIDYWCWTTWHPSYAEHPFTKELPHREDFNFHYEKIKECHDATIPEPNVVSLLIVACMVLVAWTKRRVANG